MQTIFLTLVLSVLTQCAFVTSDCFWPPHQPSVLACIKFNLWTELYDWLYKGNYTKVYFQYIYIYPGVSSSLVLTSQVLATLRQRIDLSSVRFINFYRLEGVEVLANENQTLFNLIKP
jgi:hypothetical protein